MDIKKVIDHFQKIDPKLAQIIAEIDYSEWFDQEDHFENELFVAICRTIIGQQLAGKAATAIFSRFSEFFNNKISAEKILKYSDADLRALGLSWAKARSVLDLASKVEVLKFAEIKNLDDEEVIKNLIQVKGIGRWTAEMFLMFSLRRENIFSLGDLGLKNGLKKYLGKKDLSDKQILRAIKKWHPYKTYGSIAMWHLLDNR